MFIDVTQESKKKLIAWESKDHSGAATNLIEKFDHFKFLLTKYRYV